MLHGRDGQTGWSAVYSDPLMIAIVTAFAGLSLTGFLSIRG